MGLVSLSCCLVNVHRQDVKTHACSDLVILWSEDLHCNAWICNAKAVICRQPYTVLHGAGGMSAESITYL